MPLEKLRILILCKTYPTPSAKHVETSCVAGMEPTGDLVRLFPVPFRLIGDKEQFKKWQWIEALVEKSPGDNRPESLRIKVDTITCDGPPIPTDHAWRDRRRWLSKAPQYDSLVDLDIDRIERGRTLGVLRPSRILGLDITPVKNPDWTADEEEKLLRLQDQETLFGEERRSLAKLRKLPFDFHYRYTCGIGANSIALRNKINDWEAGALFWRMRRDHQDRWEEPFRAQLENRLAKASEVWQVEGTHPGHSGPPGSRRWDYCLPHR